MTKITFPIRGKEGNKYLISLESFEKSVLPDEIIKVLNDIDIIDITLERISGESICSWNTLSEISNVIGGFLNDNENTILYFYCDDTHEIENRRNKNINCQKYRSLLFSRMFDRYVSSKHIDYLVNNPIELNVNNGIYINLISKNNKSKFISLIKKNITMLSNK